MINQKSLRDLQDVWYQKLRDGDFTDIESVSITSRPLLEWHNHKFASERFKIIQATRSQYQVEIDEFIHHHSFVDACKVVASHGNCRFTEGEAQLVWELHIQGYTRRRMAQELNKSKWTIDNIIKGLCAWMRLI